jgi:tetratricopeptide (TPR) repeat protein
MKGMFITNDRSEVESFKFVGSDQIMERMKDDEFVPAELLKMGRTAEAIDGYRKMKSMNENRLTYMAYTLINGKPANPLQGLALAQLACELYPTSSAAYLRLAEAHEKLADRAQAVRFYQKVLELETDNKDAREKLIKLRATSDR